MKQLQFFNQKPILEVLKPIHFIDGEWKIVNENKIQKTFDF